MELTSAGRDQFHLLFETHYAAILRYARRRVVEDAAADVAAEVFAIAWRRSGEMPADPLPWLYGVARRVVLNQQRGARRALRLSERAIVHAATGGSGLTTVADPAEAVTASLSLAAAFDQLSADDREVLALVAWEGLGAVAAAAVLGCTVPAMTMRLHRARHRLRKILATDPEDG